MKISPSIAIWNMSMRPIPLLWIWKRTKVSCDNKIHHSNESLQWNLVTKIYLFMSPSSFCHEQRGLSPSVINPVNILKLFFREEKSAKIIIQGLSASWFAPHTMEDLGELNCLVLRWQSKKFTLNITLFYRNPHILKGKIYIKAKKKVM